VAPDLDAVVGGGRAAPDLETVVSWRGGVTGAFATWSRKCDGGTGGVDGAGSVGPSDDMRRFRGGSVGAACVGGGGIAATAGGGAAPAAELEDSPALGGTGGANQAGGGPSAYWSRISKALPAPEIQFTERRSPAGGRAVYK